MYRVKRIRGLPQPTHKSDLGNAYDLQYEFGLDHLSLDLIDRVWREHSEKLAAGWLHPDKEDVEQVFEVELEEISE